MKSKAMVLVLKDPEEIQKHGSISIALWLDWAIELYSDNAELGGKVLVHEHGQPTPAFGAPHPLRKADFDSINIWLTDKGRLPLSQLEIDLGPKPSHGSLSATRTAINVVQGSIALTAQDTIFMLALLKTPAGETIDYPALGEYFYSQEEKDKRKGMAINKVRGLAKKIAASLGITLLDGNIFNKNAHAFFSARKNEMQTSWNQYDDPTRPPLPGVGKKYPTPES